jgi:translation initiation factor 5B
MQDMKNVMSQIDKIGEGVCVQASTLGFLEALLELLKSPTVNIHVSGINICLEHKKYIMQSSVMLEKKKKDYAAILAFDVKVTPRLVSLQMNLVCGFFWKISFIIYLTSSNPMLATLKKKRKRNQLRKEFSLVC